ncbi:MAG: hypothetical protein CVV42_15955 [Candidatus Riflebacteria bacterium HGW-Riflebacteria-2]|jgi:glycosyltransferase involved in cell wall biosynthesis|nr:MAG: hypothetical protein CVV42_15955 [Candidatus Riflebacteria bacterium HGW-Riflebacteria-2]
MKILINAVSARAGGGVSYLVNLLQMLPQLCPRDNFLAAIPDIELPVTVSSQPNLTLKVVPEASGNVFQRYLWENTGLIRICKEWQADRLLCVANIIPFVSPGIPVTVILRNVAPLTPRVFKMLRQYEPKLKLAHFYFLRMLTLYAARKSDSVISLSYATASLLKKWAPEVNSPVLYHGISSLFRPDSPRPARVGNEPYFLYVSNLYVYKGLEYLVEALAFDRSLPRVFVAGKVFDPGYMKMIHELVQARGVSERIEFLESVKYSELPGWYANAVAMVYPSWCENCPNILLEAMACGCPVVAMNIEPMPEICADAGFFAAPFNATSFADAMRRVLEGDRLELRRRSIVRAAGFTWEKAMQRHAEVLMS